MTTKKTFAKPSLQIVMLNQSDLIATSGGSQRVSLNLGLENPEEEGYAD